MQNLNSVLCRTDVRFSTFSGAQNILFAAEDKLFCRQLARAAVRSLYQELTLYPKPGLVSLIDNGSHADMNAATFMRSLFSLRHYFFQIAEAGMQGAAFDKLKQLGMAAEGRMLRATGGVNTHRGAIFCLGMLCAAIASCHAQGIALSAAAIRANLSMQWGVALTQHAKVSANEAASHGLQIAARHAVGGAREEGARGFPAVFEIALLQLDSTLGAGRNWQSAKIDALFALMAHIDDSNVYYRGAAEGNAIVKLHSRRFIDAGGTAAGDWQQRALDCHVLFTRHRLSPGGAADLLAAACLVHQMCALPERQDLPGTPA
ncbi:MAG TPA: triphosphoribosyl-dephospho-CoA synthase MdcB [Herbaspirillum sp.]